MVNWDTGFGWARKLLVLIVFLTLAPGSLVQASSSRSGLHPGQRPRPRSSPVVAPSRPVVHSVTASTLTPGLWEKVELTVDMSADYSNPFDPAEIDLTGIFTSPSGQVHNVPGFWMQPYTRTQTLDGEEELTEAGSALWRIRFTPDEVGTWQYRVTLTTPSGVARTSSATFQTLPATHAGFIRVAPNGRYYQRLACQDTGTCQEQAFFPVGENMAWGRSYDPAALTYDYDTWLPKLVAQGGNFIRLWLETRWFAAPEWSLSDDYGPGRPVGDYSERQKGLWRFEYVLEQAESMGVVVQVPLLWHAALRDDPDDSAWAQNVYNLANGGFLARPEQFFTDTQAQDLFRQRLRYILARFGYSPNILAWELCNEVDSTDGYDSANVSAWHSDMIAYLHQADPYGHLITTSVANDDPALLSTPGLDINQIHYYGGTDMAEALRSLIVTHAQEYSTPIFVGEFGIDGAGALNVQDPTGIYVHNGAWASTLSGAAGAAQVWWWWNYVETQNLYVIFGPLAAYVQDIPWNTLHLQDESIRFLPDNPDTQLLRGYALIDAPSGWLLAWIQHSRHTWWDVSQNGLPSPVQGTAIFSGLIPGTYTVEQWDTYQNTVSRQTVTVSGDGQLQVTLPPLDTDIALKVRAVSLLNRKVLLPLIR